jgi:4-diphosphocytidyl-2-C-methyl-D-erythritol kinase
VTAKPGTAGRLEEAACAKINLTLHVLNRRMDGYHALSSLVAFASIADRLALEPGAPEELWLEGPGAAALHDAGGVDADNLVMRARAALQKRFPDLRSGRFILEKHLPVASGIGGGSADAAAALRLLARCNGIPLDAPALYEAAQETGADVPVCLAGLTRVMGGVGDELGAPLTMPRLPALLVNPGIATPTPEVFRELGLSPGEALRGPASADAAAFAREHWPGPDDIAGWAAVIASGRNDLAKPAESLHPIIAEYRRALAGYPGCMIARMSGSGATVFGLFEDMGCAKSAAGALRDRYPQAWIVECVIGDAQAESRSVRAP